MNPWPFVISAYAIVLGVTLVTSIMSWRAMRRAERALDEVTRK